MCGILFLNTSVLIKRAAALVGILLSFGMAGITQAVTINFDDLVFVPSDCYCDHPITDEYLSQGLLIGDSYLAEYFLSDEPEVVSRPNYLLGGPNPSLTFVGNLPTFVSMYITAPLGDAAYLLASGPSGWEEQKQTSGFGGPDNDTPWAPKQFVSFESPYGISKISIVTEYNFRISVYIDDLTYEYTSVPEPSSLALLALCLLGFAGRSKLFGERNA